MTPDMQNAATDIISSVVAGYGCGLAFVVFVLTIKKRAS